MVQNTKNKVIHKLTQSGKNKKATQLRMVVHYCIGKIMDQHGIVIRIGDFYKLFLSDLNSFSASSFQSYMGKGPEVNDHYDKIPEQIKEKLYSLFFSSEKEWKSVIYGAAYSAPSDNLIDKIEKDYKRKLAKLVSKELIDQI